MFRFRLAQWREGRQVQRVCQLKQAKERTMNSNRIGRSLIAIAVCLVLAAVAVPETALAKPPEGKGKGGGNTRVCITLPFPFSGTGVESDGLGPYCHNKKQKLEAIMDPDGDLFLTPNTTLFNNPEAGRRFFVQLDAPILLQAGIVFQDTDSLPGGTLFNTRLTLFARNDEPHNEPGMFDLVEGVPTPFNVSILVDLEHPDGTSTGLGIFFDPDFARPNCVAVEGTTKGTVTRLGTDPETWLIEIVGTDIDPDNPDTAFVCESFRTSANEISWVTHALVTIPSFTAIVTIQ